MNIVAPMKIVLVCMDCGDVTHAPWPTEGKEFGNFERKLWNECHYIMSLCSQDDVTSLRSGKHIKGPTRGTAILVAQNDDHLLMMPLCEACARVEHGNKLVDAAIQLFEGDN